MKSQQLKSELQLLLITDTEYFCGAMETRACRGIIQGLPVVLPYNLLLKIVSDSFNFPPCFIKDHDNKEHNFLLQIAQPACRELFNEEKWTIYRGSNLDFAAILPKDCNHMLNLENYKQTPLQEILKDAVLSQSGKKTY